MSDMIPRFHIDATLRTFEIYDRETGIIESLVADGDEHRLGVLLDWLCSHKVRTFAMDSTGMGLAYVEAIRGWDRTGVDVLHVVASATPRQSGR